MILYDDTVFGGAAEGFVVTQSCVGFKAIIEAPILLRWVDLRPSDVVLQGEKLVVKGYETEFTGMDASKLRVPVGRALILVLGGDPTGFGGVGEGTDGAVAGWYCTGLNGASAFTCQGCGAPRVGR